MGLCINLQDWSFTPNLADIDGDGDGDLLMSADFGTSQVFVNNGDGTFHPDHGPAGHHRPGWNGGSSGRLR